jgi:hypothetical protein
MPDCLKCSTCGGCVVCYGNCGTAPQKCSCPPEPIQSVQPIQWQPVGWVCPICGRAMAPWAPFCLFCQAQTSLPQPADSTEYIEKGGEAEP